MLCGLYSGDTEGDESEKFGSGGAHGSVEGDALLLTDSAVLVAAVAQDVLVGARVAAQAGLTGLVEQVENNQGGDPRDDTKTTGDDAVDIAGAKRAAEGALEGQRENGDGGEKVGGRDGEEDEGGGEVGVGRPGHGQLATAQIDGAVAAVDVERVHEGADDGAAEDDDEQA